MSISFDDYKLVVNSLKLDIKTLKEKLHNAILERDALDANYDRRIVDIEKQREQLEKIRKNLHNYYDDVNNMTFMDFVANLKEILDSKPELKEKN